MQRYFVEPENITDSYVLVTGEDVKHMTKVMRMETGSHIICLDNQGKQVLCQISEMTQNEVQADILETLDNYNELPVSVAVAQSLIKGDKLDLVIQKGTEFGAAAFYLFAADRSVVKWDGKKVQKKVDRLKKIAKEAAEQSGRLYIPSIYYVPSWKEVLQQTKNYSTSVLFYEEDAKTQSHGGLKDVLQSSPESIMAVIGPEGGVSEKEVNDLKREGIKNISLGPRILRSESASLYFLACLSYQFELLR
ncbi:16S rRNA (uracil1498-N3)-methyltransferase [Alteribacillus persepolensis]|uniref:Ribosomal RNA small subunit methyltransferase E n=1 Tax=Alteribacillus persepolensis TaxID=568899 RepID=A0A1G8CR79_9BACI|nr:16S rRNA (uracil(1498)-N(3))-methyltransferase [Alteribacillus persepolensis]SDH47420.1 16S rRNA (uracil1498-N3)-methyltransferase [Alteribacillus persepolensis]